MAANITEQKLDITLVVFIVGVPLPIKFHSHANFRDTLE